jgi:hypothetical protein
MGPSKEIVQAYLKKIGNNDIAFKSQWLGGQLNPENSSNPTMDGGSGFGVAVDLSGMEYFSSWILGVDISKGIPFVITHGLGHNAGAKHTDKVGSHFQGSNALKKLKLKFANSTLMASGSNHQSKCNGPQCKDLKLWLSPENNKGTVKLFGLRFTAKKPSDNYDKNKNSHKAYEKKMKLWRRGH